MLCQHGGQREAEAHPTLPEMLLSIWASLPVPQNIVGTISSRKSHHGLRMRLEPQAPKGRWRAAQEAESCEPQGRGPPLQPLSWSHLSWLRHPSFPNSHALPHAVSHLLTWALELQRPCCWPIAPLLWGPWVPGVLRTEVSHSSKASGCPLFFYRDTKEEGRCHQPRGSDVNI